MENIFGERIRSLRDKRGIEQKQLAEIVGLSDTTISMYENGKRKPALDILLKIADALNVSVDYLLGRTEDSTPPSEKVKENMGKLHSMLSPMNEDEQEKFFAFAEVYLAGMKAQNRPD